LNRGNDGVGRDGRSHVDDETAWHLRVGEIGHRLRRLAERIDATVASSGRMNVLINESPPSGTRSAGAAEDTPGIRSMRSTTRSANRTRSRPG
jgi:hypothetical protein